MSRPPTSPRNDRDRASSSAYYDHRRSPVSGGWSTSRPDYSPLPMAPMAPIAPMGMTIDPRNLTYGAPSTSSSSSTLNMPYQPNVNVGSSRRSRSPEARNRQGSAGGRPPYTGQAPLPSSTIIIISSLTLTLAIFHSGMLTDLEMDCSYYHDAEPGQIVSPNPAYTPGGVSPYARDPRSAQPAAYTNRPPVTASYRHPDRQRVGSGDRPADGGRSPLAGPSAAGPSGRDALVPSTGNVTAALESFAKAMHLALITTSQHALAQKHFARLSDSPHVNRQTPTFEDAEKRVGKAQKLVDEHMAVLHASFVELMRRTIGITNTTNPSDIISVFELDNLKERVRKIEELAPTLRASGGGPPAPESSSGIPAPPPPAEDRPPTPPAPPPPEAPLKRADETAPSATEKKKYKVGAILDEITRRLDIVENIKNEFDSRIDEVETALMAQDNDALDREIRFEQRRKYDGWGDLEDRRDSSGTIRGLKRKERDDGGVEESGPSGRPSASESQGVDVSMEEDVSSVRHLQREVARLSGQVRHLQSQLSTALSTLSTSSATAPAPAAGPSARGAEQASSQPQVEATADRLNELRLEVTRLAEQFKNIHPQFNGNVNGTGQPGQNDIADVRNMMNAISSAFDTLSADVKTLMKDKAQRTGVFEKISSGIQALADTIQRCRADYTNLTEVQKASAATILLHTENLKVISNGIASMRNEINTIRQGGPATGPGNGLGLEVGQAQNHSSEPDGSYSASLKDQEIQELKNTLSGVQNELKEMKDGREAWTKEVMAACLEVIRDENEKRKEDYAKIAKQEISKTIKDYMSKRTSSSSSTAATSTSTSTSTSTPTPPISQVGPGPPDTSPAIPPSTIPPTASESHMVPTSNSVPFPVSVEPAQQTSYPQIPIYQDQTMNGSLSAQPYNPGSSGDANISDSMDLDGR
ncbi:uncharacterized protein I303_108085 [Kwoniella dejecticola CBS 10117]|uniref:Uncharacterized protein n=1 Tax=Kwoniella dejecticola CBS 10117 TaxID=1296121 RepID=A0A1A5ZWH5_9TREE|nr:uncharacterized protein I303_08076 [Kwoniella dejecticola CBS 10117]OBR82162.1 hypothetical protein I303_08076 [Kwoniella dejecticola CBS 10117]